MHVFLDAGNGNVLAFFELPTKPEMGHDPNTPACRITSYNVCYTKLLRFAPSATQARAWSAAYAVFALACAITAWQAQRALAAGAGEPVVATGVTAAPPATAAAPGAGDS